MQTIYKKVLEKFTTEKKVLIKDYNGGKNDVLSTSTVDINEEEFKTVLGSKDFQPVWVFRETFVIEFNEDKSKIVAKKYTVRKHSHLIVKPNKTILKTYKSYVSLTFDIKTGGFSLFKAATTIKNQKTKPFIRKNAITNQVLEVISDLFDVEHTTKNEGIDGLNIISEYLGYRNTVKELCDIYNYKIALNIKGDTKKDQIKFFILTHHLLINGIEFNPINMLEIGVNFRNNKKKYIGKRICDYYADELEIDNPTFVMDILSKKDYYNTTILSNQPKTKIAIDGSSDSNDIFSELVSKSLYYMKIDFINLKFLYHLGYTSDQIITTKLADMVFSRTADNYYDFNDFKATKKVSSIDIRKNSDVLNNLITEGLFDHSIMDLFSLQKRLEVVYHLKMDLKTLITNKDLCAKVESILTQSTNKTGVYTVNNKFLNGLKKYAPEGTKISIGKVIASYNGSNDSVAYVNVKHKKDSFTIYVNEYGIKWWELGGQNNKVGISVFDAPKKNKQSELGKAIRSYEISFNTSTKPTVLRANYSKKHFESLLGNVITHNMYENVVNNLVYLKK